MSRELIIAPGNQQLLVPAHLQGFNSGVGKALMEGVGGAFNRIGLKGNRFRMIVGGQELTVRDENYVDVVIVGAAPGTQRLYYDTKYGNGEEKTPPTCYSRDGKTPSEDVTNKQSSRCDICPQNQVGSAFTDNGKKTRACSFFRRLVVWVVGDDPDRVFTLDVKAMGLFGDSKQATNQFSLSDYAKWCSARGIDPSTLVTRISFDTDESVPKLLFKPAMFITPDLTDIVATLVNADQTHAAAEVSMRTVDRSGEVDAPAPLGDSFQTTQRVATPEPAPTVAPARRGRPPSKPVVVPAATATQAPPPEVTRPAPTRSVAPAPVVADSDDADLADLLASLGD